MEGKGTVNIQHPEAWQLLVSIDDGTLDYILYTPSVAGSLIIGNKELADDSLQVLEDAIYDTPELLNEYKRVSVIVHSRQFVLLPQDVADEDCLMLARRAFQGMDGDAAVCAMPENGVKIAFLMPRGMQAFLGRTFNYPAIYHHLMPLCEHFKRVNRDSGRSQMFLHLQAAGMDMAIYRDGGLLCANTYPFANAQDAAYYALNAWRTHGLDQLSDELQLAGDGDLRALMTPMLREYVKYVMPAEYPAAAMQLGRNAMQAPLDLILLALCE